MQQASKVKVLLAEDDLSLGYVIKDNLIDAGYEVVLCPDGQAAIDKFDKNEFAICLLDVMMPNKDGFAVAKKIRQQSDMVPILFLTAKSMEEDKIKGFQSGADDYITKPFSIQELLMRMEVFLRRTRKMHSEKTLTFTIGHGVFAYGVLINDVITFIVVAAVVFFVVVRPLRHLQERRRAAPEPESDNRPCPQCLSEIPLAAKRCSHCTQLVA